MLFRPHIGLTDLNIQLIIYISFKSLTYIALASQNFISVINATIHATDNADTKYVGRLTLRYIFIILQQILSHEWNCYGFELLQ